MKRVGMFVIVAALIARMAGCFDAPPPKDREIWNWHDLDAVRRNPWDNYRLMNHLAATTPGYKEMASPTANGGKGWAPIRDRITVGPRGTFDGQGYDIRDLFIHRPDESYVGLFGSFVAGTIQNLGVVNASVTGNDGVGGLVGGNHKGDVRNSYFSGNVTGSKFVGGLVGTHCPVAEVSNCYSSGSVAGDQYVGGLVGKNHGGVTNSYSSGSVCGNRYVGGLVGKNRGGVINSYSSGTVSGNGYVGGLVGTSVYGEETVRNSFWDVETSGQTTSAGGTGKTTAEMKNIATFTGAGWNITAVANPGTRNRAYIWNIVDGVTYPFLSWQPVA